MIESIDQKLLDRIARGDRKSLEEIHITYYPEIRRFMYYRVGANDQLAEDLASTVFLNFFEYISRGNAVGHVRGFLYRSAKNELAHYFRDRRDPVDIEEVFTHEIVKEEFHGEKFDFQLDVKKVFSAIEKLKDEWRDVILMRFMRELDYEEIAQITGKSEGAIRVIIYRALQELRNIVGSL